MAGWLILDLHYHSVPLSFQISVSKHPLQFGINRGTRTVVRYTVIFLVDNAFTFYGIYFYDCISTTEIS